MKLLPPPIGDKEHLSSGNTKVFNNLTTETNGYSCAKIGRSEDMIFSPKAILLQVFILEELKSIKCLIEFLG